MKKLFIAFMAATFVMIFTGCSKDNENGRLVVKVTDAPFPIDFIDEAIVTITKVEIRKAGDGISDSNPFLVVWTGEKTLNLLDLRNGVVEELADILIPRGEYDLVRLYVDEADLKVKDGGNYSVKVPSGQQTGIKIFINPALIVEGGLTSELLLDFDLSDSFVIQGNMDSPAGIKGFIFKPVIRAVNNSTTGSIMGLVTDKDNAVIAGALIKVKQGDVEVEGVSAITDADGKYAIIGLPPGTYSVVVSKDTYETATVNDVKVVAGNKTTVNFLLLLQ
jgi:uncharacterized surface anchored protein